MATRPTTLRGMFILALNTFAINTRVPGIKIAEKIGKMFEAAVEEKQARAGRGSKKETLQQIASEISASFPRWQKLYPGARRERVIAGGKVAWHYTRTENIALLPKDKEEQFRLGQRAVKLMQANPGVAFPDKKLAEAIASKARPEEKRLVRSEGRSVPADDLISVLTGRMQSSLKPYTSGDSPIISEIWDSEGRKYLYSGKEVATGKRSKAPAARLSRRASKKDSEREADLYPEIAHFLYRECGVLCQVVASGGPSKDGVAGNWRHPDVVGMEPLSSNREWSNDVVASAKGGNGKLFRLWSCEVKTMLNGSNVREAFFQAVSNSSWANYGYLAATTISDESVLGELRILSDLHGIGVILLGTKSALGSRILMPARERAEVDWSAANKLAQANRSFSEVIGQVRVFAESGRDSAINFGKWKLPEESEE